MRDGLLRGHFGGLQLSRRVMGSTVVSATFVLMRKRPSCETSYCGRFGRCTIRAKRLSHLSVFPKLFDKIYAPLAAGLLHPYRGDRLMSEERLAVNLQFHSTCGSAGACISWTCCLIANVKPCGRFPPNVTGMAEGYHNCQSGRTFAQMPKDGF